MQRLLLVVLVLHQCGVDGGEPPDQLHLHVSRSLRVSGGSRVYTVCGGHRLWNWSNLKRRGLQLVAIDSINNQQSDCVPPHLGWDERTSVVKEFGENKDYYEEEDSYDYDVEDSGQVSSHQKSLQSVTREAGGREVGDSEIRGCEGATSTQVLIVIAIITCLGGHLITCLYIRHLAYHVKRECAREAAKTLSLIQPRVSPRGSDRGQADSEQRVGPSDISLDD